MSSYIWCHCWQAGAGLAATVSNDDDNGSSQPQQDAVVQHIGDGVYVVSATLERAGRYHIAIQLEGSQDSLAADAGSAAVTPLQCEVVCVPAAAAAQCCRTELQAEPWVAGRAADIMVHQFDRQGASSGVYICLHECCLQSIKPVLFNQGANMHLACDQSESILRSFCN